jgi:thioredoxin reductase (NADPH)
MSDLTARRAQMFPPLTEAQVARVARFGKEQSLTAGEILFEQGDYGVPFYVVVEGALEVLHPLVGKVDELVTVHHPREFTGEVNLLADRRSLVRGRATIPTRVIRVEPKDFRALVQTDSELSELLLRAFILRRMGLLAGNMGDVILVGSRHSGATLRVQEFLTRNAHPYATSTSTPTRRCRPCSTDFT